MGMQDMKITQDMLDYWKEAIPSYQFADYTLDNSLEGTLYYPNVKIIGSYSFYKDINSVYDNLYYLNLPEATYIMAYAFYSRKKLNSINLPLVTHIESQAFYNCTSLTSIELPSATIIGSSVFGSCSNLTSVTLGSNLTSIYSAFSSCPKLAEINIYAPKSQVTTAAQAPWSAPSTCQVNWLGGE